MEGMLVYGSIPFESLKDKKKAVLELKEMFGIDFKYTIEGNLITYETLKKVKNIL